jgi:hypothetical protein
MAAVGLALIASGPLAAQGTPTQIRPAQGTEASQCDPLLEQVQSRMNTALAVKVRDAAADIREAQDLCIQATRSRAWPFFTECAAR